MGTDLPVDWNNKEPYPIVQNYRHNSAASLRHQLQGKRRVILTGPAGSTWAYLEHAATLSEVWDRKTQQNRST